MRPFQQICKISSSTVVLHCISTVVSIPNHLAIFHCICHFSMCLCTFFLIFLFLCIHGCQNKIREKGVNWIKRALMYKGEQIKLRN